MTSQRTGWAWGAMMLSGAVFVGVHHRQATTFAHDVWWTLETGGARSCDTDHKDPSGISGQPVLYDAQTEDTFVLDQDRNTLTRIDKNGRHHHVEVGAWPEQMVRDQDGRIFVSARGAGRIDVIEDDERVASIPVGSEPRALAFDADSRCLFVGLMTEKKLVAIHTLSENLVHQRNLDVSPKTLALSFGGLAVLPDQGGTLEFFDRDLSHRRSYALEARHSKPWHGQTLLVHNGALLAFHAGVNTGISASAPSTRMRHSQQRNRRRPPNDRNISQPATSGYGGGVARPMDLLVSVFEPVGDTLILIDNYSLATPDVSAAMLDGNTLLVASLGTQSVSRCQRIPSSPQLGIEQTVQQMLTDPKRTVLSYRAQSHMFGGCSTVGTGHGIRGLTPGRQSTTLAYAAFDRKLVALEAPSPRNPNPMQQRHPEPPNQKPRLPADRQSNLEQPRTIELVDAALTARFERGRELFHTADDFRISSMGLSCASCHPDGRDDGLVWQLDGEQRQTMFLADRLHDTAPFNWRGSSQTLEANIKETILRLGGSGVTEDEVQALAHYIQHGLPKPTLPQTQDTLLVEKGRTLFHSEGTGCNNCHDSETAFTDKESYDVGSAANTEPFDVPSLRYISLSAPYFHNGSAQSLEAIIRDNHDRMGNTSHLDTDDRLALTSYLKTL